MRTLRVRGLTQAVALPVALLVALTGCAGDPPRNAAESTTPNAASPPTTAAPVPPRPAPQVGECRDLGFAAATESTDDTAPGSCKSPHTATTYAVGQLDLVVDGHLLAMDSAQVRDQLDDKCTDRLARWVKGDAERLRLSRLRAIWFRPDVEEADRGASWFRCDVVAVASQGRLARYTGNLKGVLDQDSALDRFGICGTANPSAKNFRKVICSGKHRWRAVSTVELGSKTKYLGRKAAAIADTACQDRAIARGEPSMKFAWAFQWPTREDFDAGQRYGWCWLPR